MRSVPYPEIPQSEYRNRLAQAAAWMRADRLDGLILLCDEDVAYFTGFRRTFESPYGWFQGAVLTPDERVAFVVPDHNLNITRKTCWVEDVRDWGFSDPSRPPREPTTLFLQTVRDLVPGGGRLGAELGQGLPWRASIDEIDAIKAGLAGYQLADASPRIWRQRAVKTPYEIDCYRRLGDITAKGFLAGLAAIREGVTEREVLQVMWQTFIAEGAHDTPMRGQLMIRAGRDRYDMFAARPSDRPIRRGDQVMLDSGPCYRGYLADIQRQACVGPPPPLQERLYARGLAGLKGALSAVRAGARVGDVHRAAVCAMETATGDPVRAHLTFFGHGVGLANHEPPWIRADGEDRIEAGMVLSVEVPSYDVPEYRVLGAFLEDMLVVTPDGHENLTAGVPHELWIAS